MCHSYHTIEVEVDRLRAWFERSATMPSRDNNKAMRVITGACNKCVALIGRDN